MPTYEYICNNCKHSFEAFHAISKRLTKCPKCSEESLVRCIGTGSNVIFKGDGFYCNDKLKSSGEENDY